METKKNNRVFIIIKATSVDYHGRYEEIINVYANKLKAQEDVDLLNSNRSYDVEYWIDGWTIKDS